MDLNLTPEELRRLFDAVYERDMARLRKEHEELKASVKRAELDVWKCNDQTRQGT